MRADPAEYDCVAPESLGAVISLLAAQPGEWRPLAGGTDVMVLYAAGKLPAGKFVSIWNLPELRRITVSTSEVMIGAACTYSDIREHDVVTREFPMLAAAASWTGGIANQNRGTLGGNIANASPAGDSLPPLLAYDAQLILASVRGDRRISYRNFHHGYKQTAMAADELIRGVCLPRIFSGYFSYARKVGARRSQAIAKVCIAALAKITGGVIDDARIAIGSVAPVPLRLSKLEDALNGRRITAGLYRTVREFVAMEIAPVTDIRSNAEYRIAVAQNLGVEFLDQLGSSERRA
jgi:CO/xanthine dehydrogenase FAD-binding subunit